jgi:hypothetical protein
MKPNPLLALKNLTVPVMAMKISFDSVFWMKTYRLGGRERRSGAAAPKTVDMRL